MHVRRDAVKSAQRKTKAVIKASAASLPAGASLTDQLTLIAERLSALATAATELGNITGAVSCLREIRETLRLVHEMLPQTSDFKVIVHYENLEKRLFDPTQEEIDRKARLRQIAPAILLEVPHPLVWAYLKGHLKDQLPHAMQEAEKLFSSVTQEERDEARREIESDLNGGTATASEASPATSKPN